MPKAKRKKAQIAERRTKQFLKKLCVTTSLLSDMQEGFISDSTLATICTLSESEPVGVPRIQRLQDLLTVLPYLPEGQPREIYTTYREQRKSEKKSQKGDRRDFYKNLRLGNPPPSVSQESQHCNDETSNTV